MKARPAPLAQPPAGSPRYWTVEVTGKGAHLFRAPYYGHGQALFALAPRFHVPAESDTRTSQERAVAMLPYMGAAIGLCWHHRGCDLETVPPTNPTPEALEAYGNRVAEELQDADYDLLDILNLFGEVMPEITRRQSLVEMAARRADFSLPPPAASTSN